MSRNPSTNGLTLQIDSAALKPIVQAVVAEVLAQVDGARAAPPGKQVFSEGEAAQLLGVETHVLRDERGRGRITFSRIVGRRIRYTQADIDEYLRRRAQRLAPEPP